ncbi:MAG: hypothetical protein EXR08_03495 [Alphaproteobacteria bacterium]|nr:hypothetical protein [Alphaproteobacteria bacterium]
MAGFGMGAYAAEADKSGHTCDKAALSEIDYYTCEGTRLRTSGMALEAQARAQVTKSKMMGTECGRQQDEAAVRDCSLMSSDLMEDSVFKHAEAADILNQAARMEERAADLGKAHPNP